MFTQQHYEAIAQILHEEYNVPHTQNSLFYAIVDKLTVFFENDNALFKPGKFKQAVYK